MDTVLSVGIGQTVAFYVPRDLLRPNLVSPLTVAVSPGSGGTVTVEYQVAQGGAWRTVTDGNLAGALAAAASDVLVGPVFALRAAAATAAATVEIAQ